MSRKDIVPWIGTKVDIIDGSIYQLIGERKWAKTRLIIKKLLQMVALRETWSTRSSKVIVNY